jgi:hypothetical protein
MEIPPWICAHLFALRRIETAVRMLVRSHFGQAPLIIPGTARVK